MSYKPKNRNRHKCPTCKRTWYYTKSMDERAGYGSGNYSYMCPECDPVDYREMSYVRIDDEFVSWVNEVRHETATNRTSK